MADIDQERQRFEAYVRQFQPKEWPNPDADGSRVWPDTGVYRNKSLQLRWETWQAALDPAEVKDRAKRIEFAADALAVVERRRDELKRERDEARALLREQPRFVVLKGAQPGDIAFLTPGRELSMEEARAIHRACTEVAKDTGVKIVLLQHGFTIDAKDAEEPQLHPDEVAKLERRSRHFDPSGQDGGEQR